MIKNLSQYQQIIFDGFCCKLFSNKRIYIVFYIGGAYTRDMLATEVLDRCIVRSSIAVCCIRRKTVPCFIFPIFSYNRKKRTVFSSSSYAAIFKYISFSVFPRNTFLCPFILRLFSNRPSGRWYIDFLHTLFEQTRNTCRTRCL